MPEETQTRNDSDHGESHGEGAPDPGEVTMTLDGRTISARRGEVVIKAAERAGTYIPRFCYHPRMKSVGVCRMCLVEVSGPRGSTLQPSCYVEVADGMEVSTKSEKVKKAQDGVLEFLLVNHPLDCPVCDKGGECPLQDQTLAYGPGESRFIEEKRHFEKPVVLSDLVLLDRERCIQCSRCTRFASEVAGEAQIDFAGRGEQVEVAAFPDTKFTSYFSGNTVQICPVGALTASPYRFSARPWDLDQVESTCTTCSVGCRVAVQSSLNRLTRILGIDSEPVNHGWLCDKGRFVFESVNGDEVSGGRYEGEVRETGSNLATRISEPLVKKDGTLVPVSWNEALRVAAKGLLKAKEAGGPEAIGVIGGARLTNESAYAWAKLAKGVIGTDSVDAQIGDGLSSELVLSLPRATIDEASNAEVVVTLCGDIREELPVLFLRLRESVVAHKTSLIEIAPCPTELTKFAEAFIAIRPGDAPAIAGALTRDGRLDAALSNHPEGAAASADALGIATRLLASTGTDKERGRGRRVVVVVGRQSMAEGSAPVEEAARILARELPEAKFLFALRRGNVFGAIDMGLAPGLLPGRVELDAGRRWFEAAWGAVPDRRGRDTTSMLMSLSGDESIEEGNEISPTRALLAIGADPLSDFPDRALAVAAIDRAEFVVAVTGHRGELASIADVVLPVAVSHERPGTTTNIEGRVTRLGHKVVAPGHAWPDWMIASELAGSLGGDLDVDSVEGIRNEIANLAPAYLGLSNEVMSSSWARDGVVVPIDVNDESVRSNRHEVLLVDPVALPGVDSVERQGAPPRVGSAGPPVAESEEPRRDARDPLEVPQIVGRDRRDNSSGVTGFQTPPADSYSLRLVAQRCLYDSSSAVASSPSLSTLVSFARVRANGYDLDRLGVKTGDLVKLRSARGSLVLEAHVDSQVPRGVAVVGFNLPLAASNGSNGSNGSGGAGGARDDEDGVINAVSMLIDASSVVNDVRMESL